MTEKTERQEVLFEGLTAGEVASKLFEEYITAGWRVVGQEVLEKGERMDVRVTLEREVVP